MPKSAPPTSTTKVKGNYAPEAGDDSFSFSTSDLSVPEFVIRAADLLGNDSDANRNDTLRITGAQGAEGARVEIGPDGILTVFPANPLNPDAAFTYTVSDGQGGIDQGAVSVDWTLPNHAPVAADDSIDMNPGVTYFSFDARTLLENDTDPDGDTLSVSGIQNVSGGRASLSENNLEFTFANGYGLGSLEYVVTDGKGGYDVGLLTFA